MGLKNKKIICLVLATDYSNGPFFWARTHQFLQGQKQEKEKENYFIKYLHLYLKILLGHHFGLALTNFYKDKSKKM